MPSSPVQARPIGTPKVAPTFTLWRSHEPKKRWALKERSLWPWMWPVEPANQPQPCSLIAERVIGMDISANMLACANRDERVCYVRAQAEAIPLPSRSLPAITTALAFHWFDRQNFLREAWRVLSADGLLLVYNNGFTGKMKENPAFQNWSQDDYLEHFPIPPRDSKPLTPEEAAAAGFSFIKEESFENEVVFTPAELAAYLATQTNVTAAVEEGRESLVSANQWLYEQVRPFFPDAWATFIFRTRAWYLRKKPFP